MEYLRPCALISSDGTHKRRATLVVQCDLHHPRLDHPSLDLLRSTLWLTAAKNCSHSIPLSYQLTHVSMRLSFMISFCFLARRRRMARPRLSRAMSA